MSMPPRPFMPGDRVSYQPVPDEPPELGHVCSATPDPAVVFVSFDSDHCPRPFHRGALALVEEPSPVARAGP
jgi:hypothetical protein